MENEFWINLPSKDLAKARGFYSQLGFELNERHSSPGMLGLFAGKKKIVLNLFDEKIFQGFIAHALTDAKTSNEVLFSLGATSSAEVDELAKRAVAGGGALIAGPGWKDGWLYGCIAADPDGHRWNFQFMDMSKLPKG